MDPHKGNLETLSGDQKDIKKRKQVHIIKITPILTYVLILSCDRQKTTLSIIYRFC